MGWTTVPYEMAMERILERDEESAAPMVPEERANAAEGVKKLKCLLGRVSIKRTRGVTS